MPQTQAISVALRTTKDYICQGCVSIVLSFTIRHISFSATKSEINLFRSNWTIDEMSLAQMIEASDSIYLSRHNNLLGSPFDALNEIIATLPE